MNTTNLPFWAVLALTVVLNGLYAAVHVLTASIDPQTVVVVNGVLLYIANELHVNIVDNAVATATATANASKTV